MRAGGLIDELRSDSDCAAFGIHCHLHRSGGAGSEGIVAAIPRGNVIGAAGKIIERGGVGTAAESGVSHVPCRSASTRIDRPANRALADDESDITRRRSGIA